MPEPFVTLGNFAGLDNVSDQFDITVNARLTYLKTAINVNIDDNGMVHRRQGRSRVYTGTPRCFWPRVDIGISFSLFLEGGSLKLLAPDYSTKTLLTGLDTVADMDFVYVNGRVYYTNGTVIGYIKNEVATALPAPDTDKAFKRILKAGNYIEYYRSRLYTAKGNVMSFSDAVRFYRMDNRYNHKQFQGEITMMKAVADGMYVSAGDKTYFLNGLSPEKMSPVKIAESGAFPGSAVKVGSEEILPGIIGDVVYWESDEGIFIGYPGGRVKNVTWDHWTPDVYPNRTVAGFRDDLGYGQYVCAYELPSPNDIDISGRFPNWTGLITIS